MLFRVVCNEWRGLAADRTLWAVTIVLAAVMLFAASNGARWSALQQERHGRLVAEESERLEETRAELLRIAGGGSSRSRFYDPRNPAQVGQSFAAGYALLSPAPLAPLSVGQSDLFPAHYKITLESREALFAGDELDNPTNLLAGSFDVAFVIVFLYPLLILALGYNLLSGEKESGTLALTLAQPISLTRLAAAKILARGSVVLGLTAALTLVAAVAAGVDLGAPGAFLSLATYFGVTAVYGLFWFSLALLVNAFGRPSATNAVILAGAWLTLALIVPSATALVAATLYPVPSRVEMIQAVRVAGREASERGSQLLGAYFADHPELAPEGDVDPGDYYSRKFVVEDEVSRQIAPLTDRLEAQIRGQQSVVEKFRFLSPAVLAQQALNDLSGTGYARFNHFRSEVGRFADEWKAHFLPQIFRKTVFTAEALGELPRFSNRSEGSGAMAQRVGGAVLMIALSVVLLLAAGSRALRRYPLTG